MKTSNKSTGKRSGIAGLTLFAIGLLFAGGAPAGPAVVGMGDSIGEGVQANDAAWQLQPWSYINWVSGLMNNQLVIPYLVTNEFGATQSTFGRFRIFPNDVGTNVAVSGANVDDLLNARADAGSILAINDELDLVMYPRQQSQMEYVEAVGPDVILCWIGNNDVLAAVTSSTLNASQMTPVAAFDQSYTELADRLLVLKNNGSKIVLANIPNVTDIGIVVDRAGAEAITRFPVNLPDGQFTNLPTVIVMLLEGNDTEIGNPDSVLDPAEIAAIEARIVAFNAIIEREAARIGVPVVDINAVFADIVANPPVFYGFPLTKNLFGGLFSNDGVHPNNLAHGLVTNEFVRTLNQAYAMNVPELPQQILDFLFFTDPSIDKDGDGKATGRLGIGFIETVLFFFGLTGDTNDLFPG